MSPAMPSVRFFLIRHAETEHNVAGLLAGVTDSALTNHGFLQTQRLADYFTTKGIKFSSIFSSDLQRTKITAGSIVDAQNASIDLTVGAGLPLQATALPLLREVDFGSLELVSWASRSAYDRASDENNPDYRPQETRQAMELRAEEFIMDYILPLLAADNPGPQTIAVVSHGIFLSVLWPCLLKIIKPTRISYGPDIPPQVLDKPVEYAPSWTNTGFLEANLTPDASAIDPLASASTTGLPQYHLQVNKVNSKEHLDNLRRTRGGVGSSRHDPRQQNITGFFKKS